MKVILNHQRKFIKNSTTQNKTKTEPPYGGGGELTREGNGEQQTSLFRPKYTGQSGGGKPVETALAGWPSASRWGGD